MRVVFNRGRQWLEVVLDDVTPQTFHRRGGGRWGWFEARWEHPRRGLFGEIHLVASRVREDVIAHELLHAWAEWLRAGNVTLTERNEERLVRVYDGMIRAMFRELRKVSGADGS